MMRRYFLIFIFGHYSCSENVLWQSVSNHPAWGNLSAFDCGENAADRIIGGNNATLGQFPWIARLGYKMSALMPANELTWMCGGTLISDRHVVTAAHCTNNDEEVVLSHIRLGEHNTLTNPDCEKQVCAPPVQDIKVAKYVSHPGFNFRGLHNDIAVITLATPVNFNDYVVPICLPQEEQLKEPLKAGEMVTVAGWGKTNLTLEEAARILQYILLPVTSPEVCNNITKGFSLLESEICVGAQLNRDSCTGDSGGPLMKVFDTPEGPKTFLIGAVSFGPTICGNKKPGIYSSIPHFLKWILDNMM